MEKDMLINLALLFGVLIFLIFYRLFSKAPKTNYAEIYHKVINSEEHKVKGQWEGPQ